MARHSNSSAELPAADDILAAVRQSVLEQRSDYERILLPVLGMGEQVEIDSTRLNVDHTLYASRAGTAWLFTALDPTMWLHAPLRSMLSALRNTWVLLDTERIDESVFERVRPPILPGLRRALEALDWCAADFEGRDGGRMSREEFLDEISGQSWIRFEHDPEQETSELESWCGDELLGGWSVSIREHFRLELPWKRPTAPCRTLDWSPSPDTSPFETVVSLFLIDDPYELHRLFVMAEHGFDPDMLGPLTIWKDLPDMLEEFSDDYDRRVADLRVAVADRLDVHPPAMAAVLDDWFERIARDGCDDFPTLGHIRRVDLPELEVPRPVPLSHDEPGPDVILKPPAVYAATALPPSNWLRSAPTRRRRDSG